MRLTTANTATTAAAAAVAALLGAANAANLTLTIPPSALVPNPAALPASTHATLHSSGAPLSAPLRRDGTFAFTDVAPGSYLLSVHARDHVFENLRVDVDEAVQGEGEGEKVRAWQTFRGNEWANRGEKRGEGRGSVAGGVEVRVLAAREFYQERQGFSPLSFLKNPMILMGLFSLALIVGMPYLMDNMDEETRAEFEEMQKKSPLATANPASQLQNFDLASFLAGKTDQPQPQHEKEKSGGSGSKRRG
ncbi:hypothetical protein SLS56_002747 [Neofusicoccum ribis]|uniref:ER membrane protein complex subunit 7 beta-sandwich domain-containing protein n=1 Tax=Neofusicoccum ribis TaxID=45134 RepID=A0ABR3T220_9PEZI